MMTLREIARPRPRRERILNMVQSRMYDPTLAAGGHGVEHWRRTMILAEYIWNLAGHPGLLDVVILGAAMHDMGRRNERQDPDHGWRGVVLACQTMVDMAYPMSGASRLFGVDEPPEFPEIRIIPGNPIVLGKVCDIVCRHCLVGPGDWPGLQIVSDADRLELMRGGHGATDPNRLALDVSRQIYDEASRFTRGEL